MPKRDRGLILQQLELGPMANFVYVLGDPETKECAVVDPAWDIEVVLKTIQDAGWRLTRMILTHGHPDHVNGVGVILRAHHIPVHVHKDDAFSLKAYENSLKLAQDNDKVKLGKHEITLMHAPGHTEGSQCLRFADSLLTGDTLFIGCCGRVDLPGSDPKKMYQTLRKIYALPDSLRIFPGHHYGDPLSATLLSEKQNNPYLKICATGTLDEFLALMRD